MENTVTQYGLIYYDIPKHMPDLYQKVKKLVDKTCLPVNLSVYIFDWGMKAVIDRALAGMAIPNAASIHILKFDNAASGDLEALAQKQMYRIFDKITLRFEAIKKDLNGTAQKRGCYKQLVNRLNTYEAVMSIYTLTQEMLPALKMLRQSINAEYKAIGGTDEGGL